LHRRLGGPQGRPGGVRKISLPAGIQSPDRPTLSQSLYRLSYPGPHSFSFPVVKRSWFGVALTLRSSAEVKERVELYLYSPYGGFVACSRVILTFTFKDKRYALHRRLGEPQGRSARLRKMSLPTGNRSPDRPTRSQSLYRLSYPGPHRFSFPVVKRSEFGVDLTLRSSAEVKERVELYLYSPYGPSWHVLG